MIVNDRQLRNIKKAFKRVSIKAQFYTKEVNEFGEDEGEKLLIEIDGIFYEETTRINLNVSTNGTTTTDDYKSFMLLKDEESDLIEEHMICSIKGKRYEIIEVKNAGELDLYYILRLKRVDV